VLLLLLLVVLRGVLSHPARQKLAALDTWTGGVRTHPGREEDGVFPGTGGEKRRRAYAERGAARQKGRREEGRWSAAGDREAKGIAIYASLSLSLRSAAASGLSFNVLCFCLLPGWLCLFPCVSLALGCACAAYDEQEQGGCCAWLRDTTRYYLMREAGRGGAGRGEGRTDDGRGQMAWAWMG
jgi:hypothetical protein